MATVAVFSSLSNVLCAVAMHLSVCVDRLHFGWICLFHDFLELSPSLNSLYVSVWLYFCVFVFCKIKCNSAMATHSTKYTLATVVYRGERAAKTQIFVTIENMQSIYLMRDFIYKWINHFFNLWPCTRYKHESIESSGNALAKTLMQCSFELLEQAVAMQIYLVISFIAHKYTHTHTATKHSIHNDEIGFKRRKTNLGFFYILHVSVVGLFCVCARCWWFDVAVVAFLLWITPIC